jgi:hypothetical protein
LPKLEKTAEVREQAERRLRRKVEEARRDMWRKHVVAAMMSQARPKKPADPTDVKELDKTT